MTTLLALLNSMPIQTLQLDKRSRLACKPADGFLLQEEAKHLVSSANRNILEEVAYSGRSFL